MLPSFALAFLLPMPAVQPESLPALYVVANIASNVGVVETRNLVRVSFGPDHKLAKETLLSRDQRFFSHFGGHRIALGRFIVTRYGGVIDIRAGKVIHDEQDGELLGLEGGKIVYRIDNTRRMSGLFSFDLNTRKLDKIDPGAHWALPGVKSPDKAMSVKQDRDGMIRLYRPGKAPMELGNGFGFIYSRIAAPSSEGVPCLWLDDERILTIQANGNLVILSTQGALEKFAAIQDAPAGVLSPPRLWLDKQGQVIYSCGGKDYRVDVRAKAAAPLKNYALGHGFEASVAMDKDRRRTVYHDGKVIGQWVFHPLEAETSAGFIAFAYVQPNANANLGYPDGVAVWSSKVGDWRTSQMSVNSLIGWAK